MNSAYLTHVALSTTHSPMPNDIAATIRAEIARHGRRSSELATHLNVTPAYVSRRTRGHVEWSVSEVVAIANWLNVPVSHLMGEAA